MFKNLAIVLIVLLIPRLVFAGIGFSTASPPPNRRAAANRRAVSGATVVNRRAVIQPPAIVDRPVVADFPAVIDPKTAANELKLQGITPRAYIYLPQEDQMDREALIKQFDLDEITRGMKITPAEIHPFESIHPEQITKKKLAYLALPEISSINIGVHLKWYMDLYGKELLVEKRFRDFSRDDNRLGYSPETAIRRVFALSESSSALDLKYYLKRSLWFLMNMTDPKLGAEKAKMVLIYLVSGGQHCITGMADAAKLAEKLLYQGTISLLMQEPQNFREAVLSQLDLLREAIFEQAKAFIDDKETGVTNRVLREDLSATLGILPDEPEVEYAHYHYRGGGDIRSRLQLAELVLARFFQGKVADPGCAQLGKDRSLAQQERCRSHVGYTPVEVAKELIWLIYNTRRNGGLDLRVGPDGMDAILMAHEEAAILSELLALDTDDPKVIAQNSQYLQSLPEEVLKNLYVNLKYYDIRYRNIELPNNQGIRKLMFGLNLVAAQAQ